MVELKIVMIISKESSVSMLSALISPGADQTCRSALTLEPFQCSLSQSIESYKLSSSSKTFSHEGIR